MTTNKLAIIGGSGLYDVEEFKNRELIDLQTPWGKPSDQILKTQYNNKEVYFNFRFHTLGQSLLLQVYRSWTCK